MPMAFCMVESGVKVEGFGYLEDTWVEEEFARCECELCEYWRRGRRHRLGTLAIGIVLPVIWFFELFHLLRRLCTDPVLRATNRVSMYYTGDSHMDYHNRTRDELWSWLGHDTIAILIEILMVVVLVISVQAGPMDGTFLIK